MKVIFFGLGSIGRRHARLLLNNFNHELFAFRSDRKSKPNRLGITELHSWKEVSRLSADVAFITNPTFLHIDTAIRCAGMGMNLFIEKPIDCSTGKLDKLMGMVRKKKLATYVAYCLRFHPVLKKLREYVAGRGPMHCRVVTSSYLPGWRPDKDYRNIYSAQKRKGGGVIFDLSHEIDYCSYLFGGIREMRGTFGKISSLKISSEDYADIILKCQNAIVNLHMNFFSKNWERSIRVDLKDSGHISADLINSTMSVCEKGVKRVYKYKFRLDDLYLGQLEYFFRNIKNKKMMNNLREAGKIFRKIAAFKKQKGAY